MQNSIYGGERPHLELKLVINIRCHGYNKTMKVGAGIIFFEDARGLERCLSSICPFVDSVIAIDGRFRDFEEIYDISTDGSKEVVETFSNANYYSFPNLTEIEKRNKYLELAQAQNLDFLVVIDSDEYAVLDPVLFRSNLEAIMSQKQYDERFNEVIPEVYGLKMYDEQYEKQSFIVERYNERLLYKPGNLRYNCIHSNLIDIFDNSRNFTTAKYTSVVDGITLYNDDTLRTPEYLRKSIQYQSLLFNSERIERKRIVGYETLRYK